MNKETLELIRKLFNTEYSHFIKQHEGNLGILSKGAKIQECFKDVLVYIESRDNSLVIIRNSTNSMIITVYPKYEINDHTKTYLITLSESSETFKVEEMASLDFNSIRKTILINFESNRNK
jgi:2-hydroxy-3-keto-5-methylthiopentenyl-1-phosphate phosphatase